MVVFDGFAALPESAAVSVVVVVVVVGCKPYSWGGLVMGGVLFFFVPFFDLQTLFYSKISLG